HELAQKVAQLYESRRDRIPGYTAPAIEGVDSENYYGKGYQDIFTRKPSIQNAKRILGWTPATTLDEALEKTFDAFLEDWLALQDKS
ncbi:MAG: bifunctional UDP-glucuronic acid oxidase/UDP-4-amino-4-deoxy-L-arabinose formyltransferase, partial [Acidobacteriota bacterium]